MDLGAKLSSSDSAYAKRRKQHLALINQLRAIGAQADLDLPRVVVIGNQSAGKSSLVEAISGITVPRDAGTCTRCPMECRLSSSEGPWQCQVSIRWEFDDDGSRKDEVHEVPFGSVITSKDDVELALRRAQAAILNPTIQTSKFLTRSAEDLRRIPTPTTQFSRNVVCVDLSGPELTDLAFIDLPGIIQNADTEIVHLVEDLVLSHIRGNCLILVTLPMSDDIENQKAARLAKQEDPSGMRTIGVMTKPDTLARGATKSRDLWLDVIEGRRVPLRHGYYCTCQPDDEERSNGITSAQARVAEKEFFAKTSPWSRSTHLQRFGTDNLVSTLSKHLTQIIDDTLPKLQDEVSTQLLACTERLSTLPPLITTDPSAYVLSIVTSFCQEARLYVQGDSTAASLVQENRKTYTAFKHDIRSTAPRFSPYSSPDEASGALAENLDLDEEGDQVGEAGQEDDDEYHDEDEGDDEGSEEEDDDDDDDDDRDGGGQVAVGSKTTHTSEVIYLEDVKMHIERSLTRELPNNVPYNAKVALIRASQSSWEADSKKCFTTVCKTLEKAVCELIQSHFGRYESLKSRLIHDTIELSRLKQEESWKFITCLLQFETTPFTQNGHYLQQTKDEYLAKYKDARAGKSKLAVRSPPSKKKEVVIANGNWPTKNPGHGLFAQGASQQKPNRNIYSISVPAPRTAPNTSSEERKKFEKQALAALAYLGYSGITIEDLGKLNPPDIYEQEMDVMAETSAYFHVCYKRVIDIVPMTIDNMFLFAFANSLQSFLIEKLGLGSPNAASRCASYLAEDPIVVAEREELTSRKKRLESVQLELYNFGL